MIPNESAHNAPPPWLAAADGSLRVLLITGSTRRGSANTGALATMAALAPEQVAPVLYAGLSELPAFNPDHDGDLLPPAPAELRREIAAADALLICTPEYAGTLPGSLKNLLDWTVGGGEAYGKPAAWINVSAEGRGTGAVSTLASVLGYLSAEIVEAACRDIPIDRSAVAEDGTITDPAFITAAAEVWQALLSHAVARVGGSSRRGQHLPEGSAPVT